MRHWDFESQNLGSTSDSRSRNPAGATKFQVAIATAGPKKASPQFCLCKQAAFATIGLALQRKLLFIWHKLPLKTPRQIPNFDFTIALLLYSTLRR